MKDTSGLLKELYEVLPMWGVRTYYQDRAIKIAGVASHYLVSEGRMVNDAFPMPKRLLVDVRADDGRIVHVEIKGGGKVEVLGIGGSRKAPLIV